MDGSQHPEQEEYGQKRTQYQKNQDYKVIPKEDHVRFYNKDVIKDSENVILASVEALKDETNPRS